MLIIVSSISILIIGILVYIIYRSWNAITELESKMKELHLLITDYNGFLDQLMKMSVMQYDDNVFELINRTKQLKEDFEKQLYDYDLLKEVDNISENIINDQPKEILGIVKRLL